MRIPETADILADIYLEVGASGDIEVSVLGAGRGGKALRLIGESGGRPTMPTDEA